MFQPLLLAITLMGIQSSTGIELEPSHPGQDDNFTICENSFWLLEKDEFVLFDNNTAYVSAYNKTYNASMYHVEDNDNLLICPPDIEESGTSTHLASAPMDILSRTGVGISMGCLFVHLTVFAVVRDMRNLPGYNLASLCLSLFLSYVSMIVATSDLSDNPTVCVTAAVLTQFFFLSSFLWMFVIALDVFRSILLATGSLRATSKGFKIKKYVYNSCVSWGTSLVFAVAAYLADTLEGVPESYKPNFAAKCWFEQKQSLFAFFAGPVFVIVGLNFLLFGVSAWTIFYNRMKPTTDSNSNLKDSHVMYFRLAVIMGVTWITGILAVSLHIVWVWYLFAILNTLQGLFIFFAFTCTAKVRRLLRMKLHGARRASEPKSMPTFQSYCFYANSLDKDMDKVGDDRDKSGSIDTIVIHI